MSLLSSPKALFYLVISLLLYSESAFSQMRGDTWANVQRKKQGIITLSYVKTPGLAFRNTSGSLDGVCFDIVKSFIDYVRKTRGIILKAQVMPEITNFPQFLEGVRSGQGGVFGLGNITITEARKQQFKFTPAFINNLSFIISHNSVGTLTSLNLLGRQFSNMKAYTVKGSTNEQFLLELKKRYFPTLPIIYLPTSGAVLGKVASDNRSFTSLDFNYYAQALRYNVPIKRHPVGDRVEEDFGIIMPYNSDWQVIWNEFFIKTNFRKSLEYKRILTKHLGNSAVRVLSEFD